MATDSGRSVIRRIATKKMAIGAVGIAMIAFLVWIVPSRAGATISIIQAKEAL